MVMYDSEIISYKDFNKEEAGKVKVYYRKKECLQKGQFYLHKLFSCPNTENKGKVINTFSKIYLF